MNPTKLQTFLKKMAAGKAPITFLTGAGISAESGIPTFRGPEGYWTIGSKSYHPQEMATYGMFLQKPLEVWKWYLYRLGICEAAVPNSGHKAIVAMEQLFQDRFTLITQNVDGLHLRAGSSMARTYQIHGNIQYMRCHKACSSVLYPIPKELRGREKESPLTQSDAALLICPTCGSITRPHVLWFDETYDEANFRFYSSMSTAARTAVLVVVGTSGATNLPNRVVHEVFQRGGAVIDINIEENPFSKIAAGSNNGAWIQSTSSRALDDLLDIFQAVHITA